MDSLSAASLAEKLAGTKAAQTKTVELKAASLVEKTAEMKVRMLDC